VRAYALALLNSASFSHPLKFVKVSSIPTKVFGITVSTIPRRAV
jgi:hypothetical protein